MRVGIDGAGIVIERVLNPPIAPVRRFRGVLDTAFTVALGSMCAFALTLGPAPLNTVAVSSSAAASFAGLNPTPAGAMLLPTEVDSETMTEQQRLSAEQRITERSGSTPPVASPPGDPIVQSPEEQSTSAIHHAAPISLPPATNSESPSRRIDSAVALAVIQDFRSASGLASFVGVAACSSPILHVTVHVTPSGVFPGGLAQKSLVPDPANATALDSESGPIKVAIYSC